MADSPVKMTLTLKVPITVDPKSWGVETAEEAVKLERQALLNKDEYLAEAILFALEDPDNTIEVTL